MTLTLQRFAGASFGAQNACHAWTRRCGLLLELQGHGAQGLGEASPLPGYSPDTLEDTETALSALDLRALEHALERPDILDALKAASDLLPVTQPAARMALETAALDWRARREGVSAPALFGAAPQAERTLAWLFPATDAAALHGAQAAGYRHFKLKVGASGELAADLVRVKALARALPAGSRLRLDANRSWSQAEAQRACRELAAIDVEFIEEPCMDMTRPLDTDIAIALDESLLGRRPEQLEALVRQTDARVLVLKPMLLGGLTHCLELARCAAGLGLGIVVSHTFDGPVALLAAATLALTLPTRRAQGLAPHAGLAAWPPVALPILGAAFQAWTRPGLGCERPGSPSS